MVDKKFASKGSCNSHDTTQMAAWRSTQVRWEKPYFGHTQSAAHIQARKDRLGECPHCDGIGCKRCRRYGITYARWLGDTEDE